MLLRNGGLVRTSGKKVRGRACRPLGEHNVQFKVGSCRTKPWSIGSLVQAASNNWQGWSLGGCGRGGGAVSGDEGRLRRCIPATKRRRLYVMPCQVSASFFLRCTITFTLRSSHEGPTHACWNLRARAYVLSLCTFSSLEFPLSWIHPACSPRNFPLTYCKCQ